MRQVINVLLKKITGVVKKNIGLHQEKQLSHHVKKRNKPLESILHSVSLITTKKSQEIIQRK